MAAGSFRRALVQVVQVGLAQSGLFLLGMAVAAPAQTSVSPKSSSCSASTKSYADLMETTIKMLLMLLGSIVSAMIPIHSIRDGGDLSGEGFSIRFVRFLRVAGFVAVLLSLITMVLGFSVTYQLLIVKTSLPSCWSDTTTRTVIASYGVISIVCLAYYIDTFRVVLLSD